MMVLGIFLALLAILPKIQAAPHLTARPRAFIAEAQVAVVRLTASYYAQTAAGALNPAGMCTGLGTVVGTIGNGNQAGGDNARTYVLTDAQLVSPVQPCAGVVAAYLNANKTPPAHWRLNAVQVYLNTTYTGTDAAQQGMLAFHLDISALPTNGTAGPIVLPLTISGAPTYDLPVIAVPATQPNTPTQLLDLGSASLQPYTQDAITQNELPSALTPIETGVTTPPLLPTPSAIPTVAPTVTGTPATTPTVTPTSTATVTINLTPAPQAALSIGAPLVSDAGNGQGTLAGMVVQTPTGQVIVGVDGIHRALAAAFAVSYPGTFDQHWQAGLAAYYAASPTNSKDPSYATAVQQFSYLQQHYTAFGGVLPWLNAAQAGSPTLGVSPTTSPPATSTAQSDIIPGLPIHNKAALIALAGALIVLVLAAILGLRALTMGRRRAVTGSVGEAEEADITTKTPAIRNGHTGRRAEPGSVPLAQRNLALSPTLPLAKLKRSVRYGMQAAGLTDPGIRRKANPNQDSILAVHGARMHAGAPQAFGLFVVADGMGGHQFGREASTEAIRVMAEHILQPLLGGDIFDDEKMLQLLKDGAEHANESLHYRNLKQRADSGTTLTAALVAGDMAFVVNVGDSRTYHLPYDTALQQVTADHSVVASLVAAGVIQPDDIYTHPKRSQIYRSLGEQEAVQVDTFDVALHPGDRLLLCSDGLWEMVRNPRIEELLRQNADPNDISQDLIDEANANGGVDNISAIVVRILGEEATPSQIGMHVLAGPPNLKGV